jgi:hypothetical protein
MDTAMRAAIALQDRDSCLKVADLSRRFVSPQRALFDGP